MNTHTPSDDPPITVTRHYRIDASEPPITPADLVPAPLPDWLTAYSDPTALTKLVKFPRTVAHVELELMTFEAAFESVLDEIVAGRSVTEFIQNDPRGIDYGRFLRWIKKDKSRTQRYEEAQEIGTEALLERMDRIAEGTDNLEDIERSKLRLAQYKFKVQAWNKRRYGDSKQIDITSTSTIDIRALIEQRDQQLLNLTSIYENEQSSPALPAPPSLEDEV